MSKIISMEDYSNFADGNGEELFIDSLPDVIDQSAPVQILTMSWDQRSRPRRRCVTTEGTRVAIALPRGTVLSDRQWIYSSEKLSVQVRSALEDVIVIAPSDQAQMCLVAHQLGNWHRSIQLNSDNSIVVEADQPLLTWLRQHNLPFQETQQPFHPSLKGAIHEIVSAL